LLTFILHHAHLFQDGLRLSVIRDILIKENFRPLFCHWNSLVRKYFHRVILYTTNRMGFFEDHLCDTTKEKPELVEEAKKLTISFTHIFQIINKNIGNYSSQPIIVSKFPVPKREKKNTGEEMIVLNGSIDDSEEKKSSHDNSNKKDDKIVWRYTDMSISQRLDTDHDILTTLAVEVTNLNKNRDTTPQQHQRYINPAFCEFLEAWNEYKEVQLSKTPHRLGEVGIPTLGYRVLTKQNLDEQDKIS